MCIYCTRDFTPVTYPVGPNWNAGRTKRPGLARPARVGHLLHLKKQRKTLTPRQLDPLPLS